MKNGIGLVLSGGGAKGAYEIGVYKALDELGITSHITAVSGTSVGALNAVLLECMGTAAEDVWLELKLTDMMNLDTGRLTKAVNSLFSSEPSQIAPSAVKLTDPDSVLKYLFPETGTLYSSGLPFSQDRLSALLDRYVDFGKLRRKIYVGCVKKTVSGMETQCFRLNSVLYDSDQKKQMVLASAALPGVYCGSDGVKIKGLGEGFFDGGYSAAGNNTPISFLYDRGHRCLIAVYLSHDTDLEKRQRFPGAEIVSIIPSQHLGGILTGTLNLTPEKIRHCIRLGYDDTMLHKRRLRSMI